MKITLLFAVISAAACAIVGTTELVGLTDTTIILATGMIRSNPVYALGAFFAIMLIFLIGIELRASKR